MPINGHPLLEYWLGILQKSNITNVLVNTHYFSEKVKNFLKQRHFLGWVELTYESNLLGTAGTIRKNINFYKDSTVLLVHADNWICCDFSDFLDYHNSQRPKNTLITMMTFVCSDPSLCGIVELDGNGIVTRFHEKVANPPGKLANAAVYLLEPEVVNWIMNNPEVSDFSTQVLPKFLGKIATWENKGIHRDIGIIETLKEAQRDECDLPPWSDENNKWQQIFLSNPIHKLIERQ